MEITQEPESPLIDDSAMPLVLWYEADGTLFNCHTDSPADFA
jgi:hypothetical protein